MEFLFAVDPLLRSEHAGYLLGSMEESVSLAKERTKGSETLKSTLDRSLDRIRLVFSVTLGFLQVCVLCLIILLGILKTNRWH